MRHHGKKTRQEIADMQDRMEQLTLRARRNEDCNECVAIADLASMLVATAAGEDLTVHDVNVVLTNVIDLLVWDE